MKRKKAVRLQAKKLMLEKRFITSLSNAEQELVKGGDGPIKESPLTKGSFLGEAGCSSRSSK